MFLLAAAVLGKLLGKILKGRRAIVMALLLAPSLMGLLVKLMTQVKIMSIQTVEDARFLIGAAALNFVTALINWKLGMITFVLNLAGKFRKSSIAQIPILGWIIKILGGISYFVSSLYGRMNFVPAKSLTSANPSNASFNLI